MLRLRLLPEAMFSTNLILRMIRDPGPTMGGPSRTQPLMSMSYPPSLAPFQLGCNRVPLQSDTASSTLDAGRLGLGVVDWGCGPRYIFI